MISKSEGGMALGISQFRLKKAPKLHSYIACEVFGLY